VVRGRQPVALGSAYGLQILQSAIVCNRFVARKQRGPSVQIGDRVRSISIQASVLATLARLNGVLRSNDASEIHAALDCAKNAFSNTPMPAQVCLPMFLVLLPCQCPRLLCRTSL
jgi:hypothetical protein